MGTWNSQTALATRIKFQKNEISRLERTLKTTREALELSHREMEYQKRRADRYKEKLDEKAEK